MGSVISALWASGKSWEQIQKDMSEFTKESLISFSDLGFPISSFFRGRILRRILRKIFSNMQFCDMGIPLRIVTFDFLRRKTKVIDSGYVWEAVLSSCAMPGIFKPINNKEGLFMDGGILSPLPVDVLIFEGVDKIISVNVTPYRDEVYNLHQERTLKKKFNILDFIFGSIETMQSEFIGKSVSLSDISIHPYLADLSWTDFKNLDAFVERGYKAASLKEEEISSLLL